MGRTYPSDPGERDRLVTIQTVTVAKGASGAPVESFSTLARVYMAKTDLSGRERTAMGQLSAPADTRFEMGYRPDMDPELVDVPKARRLTYQGRPYDIVTAALIGRRAAIELVTLSRMG